VIGEKYAMLSIRDRQVMTKIVDGQMNEPLTRYPSFNEVRPKIQRGAAMKRMAARTLDLFERPMHWRRQRLPSLAAAPRRARRRD
jgi:FixJ family two-component response regulator